MIKWYHKKNRSRINQQHRAQRLCIHNKQLPLICRKKSEGTTFKMYIRNKGTWKTTIVGEPWWCRVCCERGGVKFFSYTTQASNYFIFHSAWSNCSFISSCKSDIVWTFIQLRTSLFKDEIYKFGYTWSNYQIQEGKSLLLTGEIQFMCPNERHNQHLTYILWSK